MPCRTYTVKQKYLKNKRGDIGYYNKKIRKFIKSNKPYRPQKRGLEKKSIYSKTFGFLQLYNRKEQSQLICPSGYSISQCFNNLRQMWYGYHKARCDEKSCERMIRYAKAIQRVQNDMGITIASFPNIGLYGDTFLNDEHRNRKICENHLEQKNKHSEHDKWLANNAKKIQKLLQRPNKAKGEKILTIADDVYPHLMRKSKQTVPHLLQPDYKKGEKLLVIPDIIPFKTENRRYYRRRRQPITNPARYQSRDDMIEPHAEQAVPHLLQPNYKKGEKLLVIPDIIPFKTENRRYYRRRRKSIVDLAQYQCPAEIIEIDTEETAPDNYWPAEIIETDTEETAPDNYWPAEIIETETQQAVPHLLEPDYKKGEKRLVFTDEIPFEFKS